jgi:trk system potassium uptake protein TrkH
MGGGSNINIMKAESPGPSVGKLVPKMKSSAMILYVIYFVITTIEVIFLLLGGMTLFESLTLSFGTAGTGGFGIMNDSFVSYSPYIQWVATIFMLLFGINFNAYYFLLFRNIKEFFMEEVKYYLLIVGVSTAIIFLHVINIYKSVATALRHSAFQVATIITTTGFASTDFDKWHSSCKFILVILMFIGACAGSTGGGIKVSRIVILVKSIGKEFASYIHPRIVKKVKFEGRPVEHEIVRSINVYLITYIVLFVASMFLVSIEGYDLTTSFTSVAATLNNIGPGLEKVGPTCNFSFYKPITKFVLMFDMLAGRLELFPMLLIFHPTIIKDFFTTSMKKKGFTNNLKTSK